MMLPDIEKIYVHPNSLSSPITKKVCAAYSTVPVITAVKEEIINEIRSTRNDPIAYGKKILYLAQNEGNFLKKCPGTKGVICCNYYTINLATNCPLDCTYCILQEYLENNPAITIFTNIENAFKEIETELSRNRDYPIRIGTGELADSLALDIISGTSVELMNFIKGKDNIIFEFKTKTTNIENLLINRGARNIVISWSLNPQCLIESDEKGAASLDERIRSAVLCGKNGFSLSFHFDPIIRYDSWEKDYSHVIEKLFSEVEQTSIAWISLGCLRFSKGLKTIMKERFPISDIFYNEFAMCNDGKYRYIRPVREEIFSKMVNMIKKIAPKVPVYLCMERDFIWDNVFLKRPADMREIHPLFF